MPDPVYTTLTECVNAAGAQVDGNPRSDLTRTLLQWVADDTYVDIANGSFDVREAARLWIERGLLYPGFVSGDVTYQLAQSRENSNDAFGLWSTARAVLGLPQL